VAAPKGSGGTSTGRGGGWRRPRVVTVRVQGGGGGGEELGPLFIVLADLIHKETILFFKMDPIDLGFLQNTLKYLKSLYLGF